MHILVSTEPQGFTCLTSSCLKVGITTINDELVTSIGDYIKDDVVVSLSNSKSFSRVSISSPVVTMKVNDPTNRAYIQPLTSSIRYTSGSLSSPSPAGFPSAIEKYITLLYAHLLVQLDIVRPPLSWHVPAQDISVFTHINIVIDSISLINGQGVLGETSSIKYDNNGTPILKSQGLNGEGLLSGQPDDYVVSSYFSPLKFEN